MASDLLALAPVALRNNRKRRYLGDDMCLPMSNFAPADQERIRKLYAFLEQLFALFDRDGGCNEDTLGKLSAAASAATIATLLRETKHLGSDSAAANPTELFAKTVHDLRSGGLSLLLARLQFAHVDGWKLDDARTVFFLTRDHLKIMRNALLGLDDPKRAIDLEPKLHGTSLIIEKWQNAVLVGGENRARLQIESQFHGHISECCVEFGALDRILYNLINNACRHTSGEAIRLFILPLPGDTTENIRFVLSNQVSEADRVRLEKQDLSNLFNPGVSTTSSGFGMTVVADFVANAYGLLSRERALKAGYVGAKVEGDQFITWFHWPIVADV